MYKLKQVAESSSICPLEVTFHSAFQENQRVVTTHSTGEPRHFGQRAAKALLKEKTATIDLGGNLHLDQLVFAYHEV